MSYYNYIDHPHYGRIWFEMTVRNWWCMGFSEEQNLKAGPCIEIVARDYALVGGGKTIVEAIESLEGLLDWHMTDEVDLPENRKPVRSSLLSRWKWTRTMSKMKRDGTLCQITKDTGR